MPALSHFSGTAVPSRGRHTHAPSSKSKLLHTFAHQSLIMVQPGATNNSLDFPVLAALLGHVHFDLRILSVIFELLQHGTIGDSDSIR